ncbi:MAG: alanine--tRNA ligase [Deltaproteobacteria bacterium]|nr:alanine--tRNA ligase [Candidatus Zymogenaceae bacterium]
MKGSEIRERFLSYFEKQAHRRIRSSSLVPESDPTLLFTNAGMVQFKNVFTGDEKREYVRATTSQKCLRVSGKHNDLENVGVTARHHTFFEMLGNFSFGDYFKEDAIKFGWEFLTVDMKLPTDKLWVTVFRDDDEAYEIWRDIIHVPEERIVRMGEKDNFWAMGDTGPCGPCSEIIIDQGEEMSCGPDCGLETCDCDRYLELWNLVFMQFNRDESGVMTPLPKPSIDTGMGLERIAAVVQGVKSNYDTDLFTPIIRTIEEISKVSIGDDPNSDTSIRAISDHCRAAAFLIADGVLPTNEGRGYVLRRIMRRAARHGRFLGIEEPFMFRVADVVVDEMHPSYPELLDNRSFIAQVVKAEEEKFGETLDVGLKLLTDEIEALKKKKERVLSGQVAFKLYDTFGFPLDLTQDIIKAEEIEVDEAGFEAAMRAQKEQSKAAWKGSGDDQVSEAYLKLAARVGPTTFTGYGSTESKSVITALLVDGAEVKKIEEGDTAEIVVKETPFYAEMGGQVGDVGVIESDSFQFVVDDTKRPAGDMIVHTGSMKKGSVAVGENVTLRVTSEQRARTEANHSATHLLHAALREVLGDHVKQAGSLVSPDRLRFDYNHFGQVTDRELLAVEDIVNRRIRENHTVTAAEESYDKAVAEGATALFGEKYGDDVRVVKIPGVSMELCGGTHADSTGEIGMFKIISEGSIASGVRRIEAVTGAGALEHVRMQEKILSAVTDILKTTPKEAPERVEKLLGHVKALTREVEKLKSGGGRLTVQDVIGDAREKNGVTVVARVLDDMDPKSLREFSDRVKDRMEKSIIALGSVADGKAIILVSITEDITGTYKANEIIKEMAAEVGGKGGGRPDMAQAGGPRGENIEQAINKVFDSIG